jgi:hypothetical protein
MDQSFGTRLRLQRERQQVALTAIAERTKIKVSMLEGLERDDVSQWPPGIFRRSFVRAYAHAIGLDPDAIVREFLDLYPEPVEDGPAALAAANGLTTGRRPPTRLGLLIGTAFGALPVRRLQPDQRSLQPDQRSGVQTEPAAAADEAASVLKQSDGHVDTPAVAGVKPAASDAGPAAEHEGLREHDGVRAAAPATLTAADDDPSAAGDRLDLSAVAHLCTRLGRARQPDEVEAVLQDAVRILDAVGLVLWASDPAGSALWPVLANGYPAGVLAQLACVPRDADNAIATAFRFAETCIVNGSNRATGAVVVPVLTPTRCGGVLALEFHRCGEQRDCVGPFAMILAAQLSSFIASAPLVTADAGTEVAVRDLENSA